MSHKHDEIRLECNGLFFFQLCFVVRAISQCLITSTRRPGSVCRDSHCSCRRTIPVFAFFSSNHCKRHQIIIIISLGISNTSSVSNIMLWNVLLVYIVFTEEKPSQVEWRHSSCKNYRDYRCSSHLIHLFLSLHFAQIQLKTVSVWITNICEKNMIKASISLKVKNTHTQEEIIWTKCVAFPVLKR